MNTKNPILLCCMLTLTASFAVGQKYVTKNGNIKFYSETPVEKIEAHNNQVNSALDASNGNFVFKVLIKSFEFEKALMQEHFNENYMESTKFPNATFTGQVANMGDINLSKDGTYDARVKGKLTIHGVTKDVEETGTFKVSGSNINGHAVFKVRVADYDIKIAKAVVDNIAEVVEVTVDVKLTKM